ILLGPVILFAAFCVSSDGAKPAIALAIKRLGKSTGAAVAGVILISLPWTIANGLDWLDKSYRANVGMYQETTLTAFNVWYLDMLVHETPQFQQLPQSETLLMGMERKAWGLALAMAAGQEDHRHRRFLAHPLQQVHPVHPGHLDIEHRHIRQFLVERVQRGLSVIIGFDLKALGFERHGDGCQDVPVIVHQSNPRHFE
ncbi:hypothetical protein LCGC14_1954980, partial [marine sediment metagenome]